MAWMEPGYNLLESFKIAAKNANPAAIGTGFVAAIFSIMGPGVIVMNAAQQGHLSPEVATSWLFSIYLVGGLFTIYYAVKYRLPLVAAYSIPGAIIIGKSLTHLSHGEAVGAYYMVALIVGLLSTSGLIKKAISYLPLPVMLGMISGVMISFGIGLVAAIKTQPALIAPPVILFFILLALKGISKKFPPILGSIILAGILATTLGMAKWDLLEFKLATPMIFLHPEFTMRAFLELALPLTVLVLGVQNIQAVGVLMAEGYQNLPINSIFITPAIGTIINAIFGAHPCVTAGPSTAICSSPAAGEDKSLRFIAAISEGTFWIIFSLSAGVAIAAANLVPKELTAMLAGLAMFAVLISAFNGAFCGKFKYGAFVSFLIAVSNVTVLNIGAPFWALIVGVVFSLLLEREDFVAQREAKLREMDSMETA
jgi:benzoate membrane transport protein